MSSDPVTVSMDQRTGCWMIQNSGRTNTLRVQQYGLSAVPLRPQTSMPMAGQDVAVWIPVVPHGSAPGKSESFRLLILSGTERQDGPGATRLITAPRRYLSDAKQEALIAYFGDHLSWPPLPAPHVRQQAEVERIAVQYRLAKEPTPERWARNRFDVLAGRDGLFRDADWFPRLGGPDRTLANHLAAFYRLVELRTITLRRVFEWADKHDVAPYRSSTGSSSPGRSPGRGRGPGWLTGCGGLSRQPRRPAGPPPRCRASSRVGELLAGHGGRLHQALLAAWPGSSGGMNTAPA